MAILKFKSPEIEKIQPFVVASGSPIRNLYVTLAKQHVKDVQFRRQLEEYKTGTDSN